MIDMHSHILPGIDDGSESVEESLEILKKMSSLGFRSIVATPHYITGSSFRHNNTKKEALVKEIQTLLDEQHIDMKIYLGNEVYIDNEILSLIEKNEIACIHHSKYILIELPRNGKINDLDQMIFTLRSKGIVPIIAHPERYHCLQEDVALIDELVEKGALLQVNFESLDGKYGKNEKKLAEYLLKNQKLHFLGSDIHHEDSQFFKRLPTLKKAIIKFLGEEKFREVTYDNPLHVLKDEYINGEFSLQPKKKFQFFHK